MIKDLGIRVLVGRDDVTEYVQDGLTFANADPGGYETAQIPLPHDPGIKRGTSVVITLGMETAWAGRVQRAGRKLAGVGGVALSCEGYRANFKEPVQEIWIDRDHSSWQDSTSARKLALLNAGIDYAGFSILQDESDPAIETAQTDTWKRARLAEAWYDGNGIPLQYLFYSWKRGASIVNPADPNWLWATYLLSNDTALGGLGVAYDQSGYLTAPGPGSGTLSASIDTRTWAMVQMFYDAAGGTEGQVYPIHWYNLAVVGRHGLPIRTNGVTGGFYPDDLFRDVLRRMPEVRPGVIDQASSIIVAHQVAKEPTPGEEIMGRQALIAGGWHWGVWASPGIFGGPPLADFRRPPERATVYTTSGRCDDLELEEDLSNLYNRALVTYTKAGSSPRVVEVLRPISELADAGIDRKTLIANLGEGDADSAAVYGAYQLAIAERSARAAGYATTSLPVLQVGGAPKPACLLRSGIDMVKVIDIRNLPLFARDRNEWALKRVEATVARDGIKTRLELGLGADLQEVLDARLQAAVELATFGR